VRTAIEAVIHMLLTWQLDLQHHLFLLTLNGLHMAPLPPSVHNVLDIGTGTGLWAIEFGAISPGCSRLELTMSSQHNNTPWHM
jgi:methylase of polypeptide subunit release factors